MKSFFDILADAALLGVTGHVGRPLLHRYHDENDDYPARRHLRPY